MIIYLGLRVGETVLGEPRIQSLQGSSEFISIHSGRLSIPLVSQRARQHISDFPAVALIFISKRRIQFISPQDRQVSRRMTAL